MRTLSTIITAAASLASLTVAIMHGLWPLYGLSALCLGMSLACWIDLDAR